MSLTVELVTPTRAFIREEVDVVSVPTPQGEISILSQHVPLVTAIAHGELRFRRGADTQVFAVSGGVLAVRDGSQVVILADAAERAEEISEAAADEAYRRAAQLRARVAADEQAFASATAALERELARLRVARKFRHHGQQGPARGTRS